MNNKTQKEMEKERFISLCKRRALLTELQQSYEVWENHNPNIERIESVHTLEEAIKKASQFSDGEVLIKTIFCGGFCNNKYSAQFLAKNELHYNENIIDSETRDRIANIFFQQKYPNRESLN